MAMLSTIASISRSCYLTGKRSVLRRRPALDRESAKAPLAY